MENINTTDCTVHGASDIQGVKNADFTRPEGENSSEPYDADKVNTKILGDGDTDDAVLEKEFDELIKGKFSKVYKRRTEGIIRRRLRSGRAHPVNAGENSSDEPKKTEANIPLIASEGSEAEKSRIEAAKNINRTRPVENGINPGCGVVAQINVSALNGRDVMSILKRVGAGENIKFN